MIIIIIYLFIYLLVNTTNGIGNVTFGTIVNSASTSNVTATNQIAFNVTGIVKNVASFVQNSSATWKGVLSSESTDLTITNAFTIQGMVLLSFFRFFLSFLSFSFFLFLSVDSLFYLFFSFF